MERYELLQPLGHGRSSLTYKARRREDGVLVALKRVPIDALDARARDKCLEEARQLQSLEHPNIIRYLDYFLWSPPSDGDAPAAAGAGGPAQQQPRRRKHQGSELVMVVEWAEGGDLRRQLRKATEQGRRLRERAVWRYFHQVCEAVRHMHSHHVLHRDLKPANVFLTPSGRVKVGDVGLSCLVDERVSNPKAAAVHVTPEALLHGHDGFSQESDLWSLGCLLYELARLHPPFTTQEEASRSALFERAARGDYPALPSEYSPELHNLTHALLLADPGQRPHIDHVCLVALRMRRRLAAEAAGGEQGPGQGPLLPQVSSSTQEGMEEEDGAVDRERRRREQGALGRVALSRRRKAPAVGAEDHQQQRQQQPQQQPVAHASASRFSPPPLQQRQQQQQAVIAAEEDSAAANPPAASSFSSFPSRRERRQQQHRFPPAPSPATGAFLRGGSYPDYGCSGYGRPPSASSSTKYVPCADAAAAVEAAEEVEVNPGEDGEEQRAGSVAVQPPGGASKEEVAWLRGQAQAWREKVADARAELAAVEGALAEKRRHRAALAAVAASAATAAAPPHQPPSQQPRPASAFPSPSFSAVAFLPRPLAEVQAAVAGLHRENRALAVREGLLWQRVQRLRLAQADAERRRRIRAVARSRGWGRRLCTVGGGQGSWMEAGAEEDDDEDEDDEESTLEGSDGSGGSGNSDHSGSGGAMGPGPGAQALGQSGGRGTGAAALGGNGNAHPKETGRGYAFLSAANPTPPPPPSQRRQQGGEQGISRPSQQQHPPPPQRSSSAPRVEAYLLRQYSLDAYRGEEGKEGGQEDTGAGGGAAMTCGSTLLGVSYSGEGVGGRE